MEGEGPVSVSHTRLAVTQRRVHQGRGRGEAVLMLS